MTNRAVFTIEPAHATGPGGAAAFGTCRHCGTPLHHTFVDLGMSPLCETYLKPEELNKAESFYPLHVFVCGRCFLVQVQQYVDRESIFTE